MTEKTDTPENSTKNHKSPLNAATLVVLIAVFAIAGFGYWLKSTGQQLDMSGINAASGSFGEKLRNSDFDFLGMFKEAFLEQPKENVEEASLFEGFAQKLYFPPVRIYSESTNLDVLLTKVSVTEEGALESPKEWHLGGWYKRGAKAGQKGNVIIDGHYDTNTGTPGAFWELKNLQIGDTVFLVDELGREFVYDVTNIFYVDSQDPNGVEIFDQTDVASVTLVTCGGFWVPGSGYDKRLVVKGLFSEKSEEKSSEASSQSSLSS
jgi:sortase A